MKTTMLFRPIANPRRTRLAALKDAEPQGPTARNVDVAEAAGSETEPATGAQPLPQQTANPKRTVLSELPNGDTAAE
jgi:hypothetical protein